jgi:hypothetical protein
VVDPTTLEKRDIVSVRKNYITAMEAEKMKAIMSNTPIVITPHLNEQQQQHCFNLHIVNSEI